MANDAAKCHRCESPYNFVWDIPYHNSYCSIDCAYMDYVEAYVGNTLPYYYVPYKDSGKYDKSLLLPQEEYVRIFRLYRERSK